MKYEEIYKALPHRYPMLFIDDICELEYGKYVKGYKNVTINEPWVTGHFPDEPVFPGVLTIETMTQISGFMFYQKGTEESLKGYICKIEEVKFIQKIVPGDCLIVEARLIQKFGQMIQVDCKAMVKEEIVAKGKITFMLTKV